MPVHCVQCGLRHQINNTAMLYPGYVPASRQDPSLLHYGLSFSVGSWSWGKSKHFKNRILDRCNALFPAPPTIEEVRGENARMSRVER